MDKVINIGKQSTYGGRKYNVYCHIKYNACRLSISGVEGPLISGRALGSCGQIIDGCYWDIIELDKDWTPNMLKNFLEIWDKWHLNDMHAECEHQEALGITCRTDPCATCPVCGYKLGSGWTVREVPQDVIDFLFSLPLSTKTPDWF